MTPQEFLEFHISKITTLETLKGKFKLYFPEIPFSDRLIPRHHENESLKIKEVESLGTFLYYSRQGKTKFHETILDIICEELRKKKIPYTRNKKMRADMHIKKYRIELEIRSNPQKQPENRRNLIERINKHPEKTVLVFCNKKDKEAYLHSKCREAIEKNNRFFTIPEFLSKIEDL